MTRTKVMSIDISKKCTVRSMSDLSSKYLRGNRLHFIISNIENLKLAEPSNERVD
jgi:hypothetical protein